VSAGLVTVAIPLLNEERHLAGQLGALAGQTYDGEWELVIADNGCTDRSLEIAEEWRPRLPELRIADARGAPGINHARNAAAAAARGELVAFCDGDDVAAPGWLAALADAGTGAELVGGPLDHASLNDPRVVDWFGLGAEPAELPVALGFLPYVPGGNCAVRRDVALAVGWDESFQFGSSDIDFAWRAQLAGHRLAFAPGAVMARRLPTRVRDATRAFFIYGRSDPRLYRRYGRLGMSSLREPVRWRTLAAQARCASRSHQARGHLVRTLARGAGRAVAARPGSGGRVTPGAPDLLEVDLRWPPETFVQARLEGLAARGMSVQVASTSGRRAADAHIPGLALRHVPGWNEPKPLKLAGLLRDLAPFALRDPGGALALARATLRAAASPAAAAGLMRQFVPLARTAPGAVHFEWETGALHHLPLLEAWRRPLVLSAHGGLSVWPFTPAGAQRLPELRVLFERAAVVHCACEAQRAEALAHGLEPEKARVILNAVDTAYFTPGPRADEGPLRIVSVGRLVWEKGWEYLVAALALAVEQGTDAVLTIAGDGPERARIGVTADALGVSDRVELVGVRPAVAVRALLRDADVFALASVSEGLPTAMLEAMSCELPVVVTDCGGIAEAVDDDVEGLVVPARSPRGVASALIELAGDPDRRREMGRAGRRRVEGEFTLDRQIDAFADLYRELAQGRA
jgi:glycosyltransferase involved in cell wall biosynthesis